MVGLVGQAEKIIVGKLKKWQTQVALLNQPFVKDTDKTVEKVQSELTAKIGEKISIRRFIRWEVGEGMVKRSEDFAAEVGFFLGVMGFSANALCDGYAMFTGPAVTCCSCSASNSC